MSKLHPIPRPNEKPPRADVIFVHGLGGDAFTAWQHDQKHPTDCWPYWLAYERSEVAVHTLEYGASPSRWLGRSMCLFDRAREVLTRLQTQRLRDRRIGDLPIVFVAHSLGGLVVKALLKQAYDLKMAEPGWAKLLSATKVVIFVATPHLGSGIAKGADRIGWLFRASPALRGLRAHREDLRGLHEWYINESQNLKIRTEAFYETDPTNYLCILFPRLAKLGWVSNLPTTVMVVESGDANPSIRGTIPRSLEGDHLSVCKPRAPTDVICRFVEDIIAEPSPEGITDSYTTPVTENLSTPGLEDVKASFEGPIDPLALPAELGDFQHRGQKQNKLVDALTREGQASAIVAIAGMGGIGKTAVAIRIAHQLKDRFPDGQRYLNLQGVTGQPLSPLEAMYRIILSFAGRAKVPDNLEEASALFRSTLEDKRVLLLLDDAKDGEQVRPLHKNRGGATMIITSRSIVTADGLTSIQLDEMTLGEARKFLREILEDNPTTDADLDLLAHRCGHLPLALRVVGRFLRGHRDWPVSEYIDAVNRAEVELGVEGETGKDVLAVLGLSAKQLTIENRELAGRWQNLSVFPDSFDRPAAAAVWEADDRQARDDLSSLLGLSMLLFDDATRRYRLHDLMRDVARLPLEGESVRTTPNPARRHARHYCAVLSRARELHRRNDPEGLLLYDLEQRNIVIGQAWAVANMESSEDAARLASEYPVAGAGILRLRLLPRPRIEWFAAQINACRKLKHRDGEVRALGNLATAHLELGDPQEAMKYSRKHLRLAREIGDRRGEGIALNHLGIAWFHLGRSRRAIEHQERALEITREIGDRRSEGRVLGSLGHAYGAVGELRRGIACHEQALAIARGMGDRREEGNALGNFRRRLRRFGRTESSDRILRAAA